MLFFGFMDYSKFENYENGLSEDEKKNLLSLRETCVLKGFSDKTLKAYYFISLRFLKFLKKSSRNLSSESVRYYLLSLDLSTNSSRLHYAALSFLFREILKKPFSFDEVPIKKKAKSLPNVLSKEEIMKMIDFQINLKHKLIIMMLYASGLRLQEIVNLKRKDIDFDRSIINVKKGKGNKDRITLIGEKLKLDILKYYSNTNFRTEYFLEGRNGAYSKKSVQEVLKNAGKLINKKVHPHMLRHSFATHLLESGVDVAYIQRLLGHSDIGTTMIYAKVSNKNISNIKSPIDN